MRVVEATRFGGPEVLEPAERPDPEPQPGQLVVEVEFAEVLFLDPQLRQGWGKDFFDLAPPYVPGVGVAGVVGSVADGVEPDWIGRRVVASTSRSGEHSGGGYAEQAVVPVDMTFAVPDGVALEDAIAAVHDGMMGVSRIELAQLERGTRVLITAAGGAVGAWLIPLAESAGATVIAAARGERKLSLARELGADEVVDYSEPDWHERASAAAGGAVDVVFDGAGGEIGSAAFQITAPGGRFFSYGSASGAFAKTDAAEQLGITVIGIHDDVDSDDWRRYTEDALKAIATGSIKPVIGQIVPLERAAAAHAAIEERSVAGKTLLQVR